MRELKSESGKILAKYVTECKAQKKTAPILWLGAGCSVSSGCPTNRDLLQRISDVTDIDFKDSDDLCDKITNSHLKLLNNRFIKSDKSSLGYSLLAQLIAKGYFEIILTTNWDFLLENSLRTVLPSERIQFYSRPDNSDTKIAEKLKKFQFDNILIIHLHGDLRSEQIYTTEELLNFEESLTSELKKMIEKCGLIFIGTSLEELRLVNIIPKIEDIWNINPIITNEKFNETFGIKSVKQITGVDALFDNFMQGLCLITLAEELSNRMLMKDGKVVKKQSGVRNPRKKIDDIVEDIKTFLKTDSLDDAEVIHSTRCLLENIKKCVSQRKGETCLIFADDPEAPGGREMRNLIERVPELTHFIKNFKLFNAHIKNIPYEKRGLDKLIPNKKLNDFKTIIILDDISFTGNTLKLLRTDLVTKHKANKDSFIAALLRIDDELLSNLQDDGWNVVYGDKISGFGLMCPWGFVRPTKAILSDDQTHFLSSLRGPIKSSDFMVQSSFGYIPKPWGELAVLRDNSFFSSRIFSLERGQRTSLHYHLLRDESFLVLDNRLGVCLWDRFIKMHRHQSLRIPAGVPHSIIALENNCRVMEIGEGFCDTQLDIVRIHDIYHRKTTEFGDNGLV